MSVKVTMNLSERDVANTEKLAELTHSRTKAQAVSTALSVTKIIAQSMADGGEIVIRRPDGKEERLIIPDLAP